MGVTLGGVGLGCRGGLSHGAAYSTTSSSNPWQTVAYTSYVSPQGLRPVFAVGGIRTAEEEFGVPRRIVSFVMPTGYSFNLDGSTLYLGVEPAA